MNNPEIRISVISIGKNCIESVADTYLSVMSQNFSSFEYVIIDGNSGDGTIEMLHKLSQDKQRITLISESDLGISDAMNKGAKIAQGILVIYLHFGDKFVDDQVLSRAWESYLKEGWVWSAGNLKIINNRREFAHLLFKPGNASELIKKNCVPHQATFLLRTELINSGGFDINLTQAMDYDLWLRLHYLRKLELFNLNMDVACFDSSGESSKILPLLFANWEVRNRLRNLYHVKVGATENFIFISRIFIYWLYYKFKVNIFLGWRYREGG